MSFQRTTTKYALQMAPSTAIPDATPSNLVSDAMMLSPRPHQPHQNGSYQVSQTCATACHNHSMNTTISCTNDSKPKSCCPSFYTYSHAKGHLSAYCHLYTECSNCVTTKVRPCSGSTKMPDQRDITKEVTVPGSMNDALDLECPWIMLAICALRCSTLSLAKAP